MCVADLITPCDQIRQDFNGAVPKLLEKVVCEQVSEYLESNKLLPDNQHGFRQKRSTMPAWADIQQDWAIKTESKEMKGVLL